MEKRPNNQRGQATVEAALGLLVFVTVLMFGIYFGEVVFLEMKVTEAVSAAVWETTGAPVQLHTIPTRYNNAPAAQYGERQANTRYLDFDGRSRATPNPILVFTRARNLSVSCSAGDSVSYGTPLMLYSMLVYRQNGGFSCTGEAWIDSDGARRIAPFLEGGDGFFQARHKEGTALNVGIKACPIGRPRGLNGPCAGRMSMLLDDWGLADNQGGQCMVLPYGFPCPTNLGYWAAVNMVYSANSLAWGTQNGADRNYVQGTWGAAPTPPPWIPYASSPTSFYMNFVGEDPSIGGAAFMSWNWWNGDGQWWFPWQTTPFVMWPTYGTAYALASGCYLGQPCNSSNRDMP